MARLTADQLRAVQRVTLDEQDKWVVEHAARVVEAAERALACFYDDDMRERLHRFTTDSIDLLDAALEGTDGDR